MKHLDLFSGIGGFALAARWCGIETVAFCETNEFCKKVLRKHWPDIPNYGDVRLFSGKTKELFTHLKDVKLITGGFPCQPFSSCGNKRGNKDERHLWPEFYRIIQEFEPSWIIAENVNGIINMELDNILNDLESKKYETATFNIPACAVSAPHRRERIWIIAHSNRERCSDGINNRPKRSIQDNIKRYVEKIQSEWTQFIPFSWKTFNTQEWLTNSNSITSQQINSSSESEPNKGKTWLGYSRQNRPNQSLFNWQEDKPPVSGMDDGLPHGLDRNKALGNAIVPQVVYPIMMSILEIDAHFLLYAHEHMMDGL